MRLSKPVVVLLITLWLTACSAGQTETAVTTAAATPTTASLFDFGSAELSGRLIYPLSGQGLVQLDLVTGEETSVFTFPESSVVWSFGVSSDGTNLIMAYSPPPSEGGVQFGFTDLYRMPTDGSSSPEVVLDAGEQELYTLPTWSPDGEWIYYGHTLSEINPETGAYQVQIERMAYPAGEPEVVVPNAFWPRLSPDGTRLAYIDISGETDDLIIANADGSEPVHPIPAGMFPAVDAPTFTPDGTQIIFSAVNSVQFSEQKNDWWMQFLGVQVARAHDVPSDLWIVSVEGGEPVRLTDTNDFGFYPVFSPDGTQIALVRGSGIYLMNPDGSDLRRIRGAGAYGSLAWLP